ncbi:hypothetical protein PENTCL1PPCAC_3709, partial [Pristionchus entomophagus]
MVSTGIVTVVICYGFVPIVLVTMIGQTLIELKHGMYHASPSTKRYQKRAVTSLIFQGVVPGLIYVLPAFIEAGLYMQTISMGQENA